MKSVYVNADGSAELLTEVVTNQEQDDKLDIYEWHHFDYQEIYFIKEKYGTVLARQILDSFELCSRYGGQVDIKFRKQGISGDNRVYMRTLSVVIVIDIYENKSIEKTILNKYELKGLLSDD